MNACLVPRRSGLGTIRYIVHVPRCTAEKVADGTCMCSRSLPCNWDNSFLISSAHNSGDKDLDRLGTYTRPLKLARSRSQTNIHWHTIERDVMRLPL